MAITNRKNKMAAFHVPKRVIQKGQEKQTNEYTHKLNSINMNTLLRFVIVLFSFFLMENQYRFLHTSTERGPERKKNASSNKK